jgi:hypothetical protein
VGNPGKNDVVMPKIRIDGTLDVKSNARALFEIPFRTSKHVAMVDEEDLLSAIQRLPKEKSLTIVLLICPNVENVHP